MGEGDGIEHRGRVLTALLLMFSWHVRELRSESPLPYQRVFITEKLCGYPMSYRQKKHNCRRKKSVKHMVFLSILLVD
jgi:hypothetical protein